MSTTFTPARRTPIFVLRRQRIAEFLAKFYAGIEDARAMADRYERLSRMTSGELRRRGLTRDDISRAVVSGHPVK
jgi:hypothetical protein